MLVGALQRLAVANEGRRIVPTGHAQRLSLCESRRNDELGIALVDADARAGQALGRNGVTGADAVVEHDTPLGLEVDEEPTTAALDGGDHERRPSEASRDLLVLRQRGESCVLLGLGALLLRERLMQSGQVRMHGTEMTRPGHGGKGSNDAKGMSYLLTEPHANWMTSALDMELCTGVGPGLRWAAGTAVGGRRIDNEDAYGVDAERGLFVVADGCGGFSSGRRASDIVVQATLAPFGAPGEPLVQAMMSANAHIVRRCTEHRDEVGMGATAAALRLDGKRMVVAHVGDCRVGRLDGAMVRRPPYEEPPELRWLTVDHMLWVDAFNRGVPMDQVAELRALHGNVVVRAIGVEERLDVDARFSELARPTMFILCSDGVHGQVADSTIATSLIEAQRGGDLKAGCAALLSAAEQAGGHDNATVILVATQVVPAG